MESQRRSKLFEVRVKETDDKEKMLVSGYALTFDEETVLYRYQGKEYKEVLDKNCLNNTIMENVPLRYNHSQDVLLLATTRNDTLKLNIDDKGLYIEAEIAPTSVGKDVYTLIKRGDVNKMSFAFSIRNDEYDSETRTTRILDIEELFDVSVVDVPAYETTSVEARNKALKNILERGGNTMTEEEKKALETEIEETEETKDEVEEVNETTEEVEETVEEKEVEEVEDNSEVEAETEEEEKSESENEEETDEVEAEEEETEETESEEAETEDEEEKVERSKQTILADKRAKAKALTEKKGEAKIQETITRNLGGNNMENKEIEIRNSKKYVDAYAEYLKNGDDTELRSLLTTNVESGTIAIPDFVYDEIKTAWDKNDIMSLVRSANIKGNLKVQFEISGSDAVVHTEGTGAVAEESLVEGIATITPVSIKKWISVSDEVMDMKGESFLRYIYDELTYKIVKKATDLLVAQIANLPTAATSTTPSARKIYVAPTATTVATGIANLSDEASDYTIVMNKLTYVKFKEAQYANNYGIDVFEGVRVRFNNSLPAYDEADEGEVYAFIGDLNHGAIKNLPMGESVNIKIDEYSRKKEDLVEILGRQYVGTGVVADKAFALLAKPVTEEVEGI